MSRASCASAAAPASASPANTFATAAISTAERCSPADFASVYCPRETISPAPVRSGPPPGSNRRVGHRRWPEESALSPAIPGLSMPWGDVLQGRRRPLLDPFHPLQLRTQLTQHGDQKKRCNESHHQEQRQQSDQPDRSHGRSQNPGEHGAQSPQPSRPASPRKLLHDSTALELHSAAGTPDSTWTSVSREAMRDCTDCRCVPGDQDCGHRDRRNRMTADTPPEQHQEAS